MPSFQTLFSVLSFVGMLTGTMAIPTSSSTRALSTSMQKTCTALTTQGQALRIMNFFPVFYNNLPLAANVTCSDSGNVNEKQCNIVGVMDRVGYLFGSITYTIDANKKITVTDLVTDGDINGYANPQFIGAVDALVKLIVYQSVFCSQSTDGAIQITSQHASNSNPFDYDAFKGNNFAMVSSPNVLGGWKLGSSAVLAVKTSEFSFYDFMSRNVIYGTTALSFDIKQ